MDAIRQSILIAEDVIAASHATLSTEESTASINSSDGQSHIAIPKVYRTAHRKRAAAACRSCRERKVRCDVSTHGSPCHNCQHDELECYVPEKKRRRYHEHSVSNSLNKQKAACHEIVVGFVCVPYGCSLLTALHRHKWRILYQRMAALVESFVILLKTISHRRQHQSS